MIWKKNKANHSKTISDILYIKVIEQSNGLYIHKTVYKTVNSLTERELHDYGLKEKYEKEHFKKKQLDY